MNTPELDTLAARIADAFDAAAYALADTHIERMGDAILDLGEEAAWLRRNHFPRVLTLETSRGDAYADDLTRSYFACTIAARAAAITRSAAACGACGAAAVVAALAALDGFTVADGRVTDDAA